MQEIKVFDFNSSKVRTMIDGDNVYFIAKDVCDVLDISKYRDVISTLEDYERGCPVLVDTLGGKQEMSTINESGLYSLIMRSRKPEAKRFKKWVTAEVLPAIRKNGTYYYTGKDTTDELRPVLMEMFGMQLIDIYKKRPFKNNKGITRYILSNY